MIIQLSEKVWYISKIDMYQLPSQCLKKSKVCACKSGVFWGLKDLGILRSRSPPKYGIYNPISILIYIWDLNWSKSIEIDLNWSRSWKDLRSAKHCVADSLLKKIFGHYLDIWNCNSKALSAETLGYSLHSEIGWHVAIHILRLLHFGFFYPLLPLSSILYYKS